jgi:hypothetical protein
MKVRMMKRSFLLSGLLALGTPTLVTPAWAEPSNQAAATESAATASSTSELNEEGRRLYQQRQYRRAVEKFIQSHAVDPDPNLLFNIARCYEALGEEQAAIEKYEQFLASPSADVRGRERAEQTLRSLRAAREQGARQKTAPVPAPAPVESAAPAPTPSPAAPTAASVSADTDTTPGSGRGWIKGSLLVGGIVAGVAGSALYYLGVKDHDRVESAKGYGEPGAVIGITRSRAQHWVDSGSSKKAWGVGGWALGAACLGTYAIVVASSHEPEQAPGGIAFTIQPERSGATLAVGGAF